MQKYGLSALQRCFFAILLPLHIWITQLPQHTKRLFNLLYRNIFIKFIDKYFYKRDNKERFTTLTCKNPFKSINMKNLTHYYVLTLFAILCLMGCKKNKITKMEIPAPEKPQEVKKLIPVNFESAGLTVHLKYKENTAMLTELDEGGGNRMVIDYTADQSPSKLEKYKNGRLFYIAYYMLDEEKKVTKVLTFDYDDPSGNYTPTGSYTLGYNELGLLHTISYYNDKDDPGNTCIRSYTNSGSLSEIGLNTNEDSWDRMTYTFDQKPGVSSHIPYSQLFTLEVDHWFLFCSGNNIMSCINQKSAFENINFSYEYNENGYPSNISISKNQATQNIKVTYKTLEL